MVHKFSFDAAQKMVTVAATGSENMDSRLASLRALREDARYGIDTRILCNFRDSRFIPDSADGFALGMMVTGYFRGHKVALVVDNSEQVTLSELITTISAGKADVSFFTETNAATQWLLAAPGERSR